MRHPLTTVERKIARKYEEGARELRLFWLKCTGVSIARGLAISHHMEGASVALVVEDDRLVRSVLRERA